MLNNFIDHFYQFHLLLSAFSVVVSYLFFSLSQYCNCFIVYFLALDSFSMLFRQFSPFSMVYSYYLEFVPSWRINLQMEAFWRQANLQTFSSLSITSSMNVISRWKIDLMCSYSHFPSAESPKNSFEVDYVVIGSKVVKLDRTLVDAWTSQVQVLDFPCNPLSDCSPSRSEEKSPTFILKCNRRPVQCASVCTKKAGTSCPNSQLQQSQGASSLGFKKIAVFTLQNSSSNNNLGIPQVMISLFSYSEK